MDDEPTILDLIRERHSPVLVRSRDGLGGPIVTVRECAGCPLDVEYRDRPVWPCATARLVYSLSELEAPPLTS